MRTIQISDSLFIYQNFKKVEGDKEEWSLWLEKKVDNKVLNTVKLDSQILDLPFIQPEYILTIPKIIDAFIENRTLYVLLYKRMHATLQEYSFSQGVDFRQKEYELLSIGGGSVDNFGGIFNRPQLFSCWK
ncbi:MAG: hypothetical protein ACK5L5_01670 [Bacteroidales bacterium]